MSKQNKAAQQPAKKGPPIKIFHRELSRSDVSIYPSYTHLSLAYDVVCRRRYQNAVKEQRNQFMKELMYFEQLQNKALDGVRVHREFSQGVLSHFMPTSNNMDRLTKSPFTLNEKMRLDAIMQ